MLGGAAVSWASKRQQTVALSSTEAEYMCACSGAQEITHIRGLMSELGFAPKKPTTLFEDNQSAMHLVDHGGNHSRSKHIDIRYHSIIYELIDELTLLLTGILDPEKKEEFIGYAEVREVFNITKVGKIAGCMVTEGIIKDNSLDFRTQHLVPSNSISKAQLLEQFQQYFMKDVKINHIDAASVIDRTLKTNNENLNSTLWKNAGYKEVPTVEENIEELYNCEFTNRIMN